MGDAPDQEPAKAGLQSAAELLKLTLALSTGALVFGASLIEKKLPFTGWLKVSIVAAWALLAIAAGAGILAISAIPMMVAKSNYDLEDRFLTWPARVHQLAFVAGILCLGAALATAFFRASPEDSRKDTPPPAYMIIQESTRAGDIAEVTRPICRDRCCVTPRRKGK